MIHWKSNFTAGTPDVHMVYFISLLSTLFTHVFVCRNSKHVCSTCFSLLFCFQFCTFTFPDCTSNPECIFSIVAKICDTECKSETCLTYPFLDEGFKLAVEDYRKKFDNRTTPEENLKNANWNVVEFQTLLQQAQLLKGSYEEQLIPRSHQRLNMFK